MKFKTVAEAFNFYRGKTLEDMRKRAKEIDNTINTDPEADIEALNIELRGIREARLNLENRDAAGAGLELLSGIQLRSKKPEKVFGDPVDTPEYRSAFFKSLLGQELTDAEKAVFEAARKEAEKRADAFTSSTDAVAVLPTSTLNEVVKKARDMGGLLGECRAFAVPSNIAVPVGTPSSKAAWHTEGEAVETEKVTPSSVVFGGYEIIKIFSLSAKTRRMSISAFESYLTEELRACVMECIAEAAVNGTGSGQGTGLLSGVTWTEGTNLVTVASGESISYTDVVNAIALLKRGYAPGAKWTMNNATLYKNFYGMVDANKRPIFISDPKGENIGRILGFDVVLDDYYPDGVAVLGNYRYMGYNLPEGIVIETSRESSFKKGLIDYRAMAIADCKPIIPEAFVKIAPAAE